MTTRLFLTQLEKVLIFRHKPTFFVTIGGLQMTFRAQLEKVRGNLDKIQKNSYIFFGKPSLRSACFFWAQKLGFRPENLFVCHMTLNFVDGPFPSYGRFRKK